MPCRCIGITVCATPVVVIASDSQGARVHRFTWLHQTRALWWGGYSSGEHARHSLLVCASYHHAPCFTRIAYQLNSSIACVGAGTTATSLIARGKASAARRFRPSLIKSLTSRYVYAMPAYLSSRHEANDRMQSAPSTLSPTSCLCIMSAYGVLCSLTRSSSCWWRRRPPSCASQRIASTTSEWHRRVAPRCQPRRSP